MQTMLKQIENSDSHASEVKTVPCPQHQIESIWVLAEPFLRRSYARSGLRIPSDLKLDLHRGHRVLWLIIREREEIIAAGITALFNLADGKMCKIEQFAGSNMPLWLDQRKVIEDYAKEQGCDRVMVEGRLGWIHMLPDYEQTAVILEKRL